MACNKKLFRSLLLLRIESLSLRLLGVVVVASTEEHICEVSGSRRVFLHILDRVQLQAPESLELGTRHAIKVEVFHIVKELLSVRHGFDHASEVVVFAARKHEEITEPNQAGLDLLGGGPGGLELG